MKRLFDIVVAGHLCLDLLPQMNHLKLSALTMPGHLFETGPMYFSTGGAVSNTGLALHRLGMNVRLMSNVGDDLIGQMIIGFLESHDPDLVTKIRVEKGAPSAYTVVLAPNNVDRIFLHCPGTNALFKASDIDYDFVAHAKIFHLGYPSLLPALTHSGGEGLVQLFSRVKSSGVITSLDMTLPDPEGATASVNWQQLLQNSLPFVDIFVPSIEEILFMLRRSDYDHWHGNILVHLTRRYLDHLAAELLEMGCAITGFKLGELGIYLCAASSKRLEDFGELSLPLENWANQAVWHPAFAVNAVGTTGAGDSAYAGLLSAILSGMTMESAAKWSCAIGASNVEAADATSGILSWSETKQRIERGWNYNRLRLTD